MLLLVLGGGGWWFTAGPGGSVAVPNVAGQTQGQAVDALHAAGLSVTVNETFNETVRKGSVISSEPLAGDDRRKSDPVVLSVSKGPERFAVPQVINQPEAKARSAVTGAHLTVGAVQQQYSETVATGRVISVSPTTGTQQKKGAKVTLVVSNGRQPITVPDVTGTAQTSAESTLSGLGLTTTTGTPAYSDTVAKGSVISQTPTTGTAHRGDTVTLIISKGPEMVSVPSVIDLSSSEARTKLEGAGLKVKVNKFFGGLLDTVRGQDPQPGQQIKKGSTVTISVV